MGEQKTEQQNTTWWLQIVAWLSPMPQHQQPAQVSALRPVFKILPCILPLDLQLNVYYSAIN